MTAHDQWFAKSQVKDQNNRKKFGKRIGTDKNKTFNISECYSKYVPLYQRFFENIYHCTTNSFKHVWSDQWFISTFIIISAVLVNMDICFSSFLKFILSSQQFSQICTEVSIVVLNMYQGLKSFFGICIKISTILLNIYQYLGEFIFEHVF